jgi:hypothetical protein
MDSKISQLAEAQAALARLHIDVECRLWEARSMQALEIALGQDSSVITAGIARLQIEEARLRELLDRANESLAQAKRAMR